MEAIILAGGLGVRLRQLIPDLPKPMAPVHGKPFLEYALQYWKSQGISRFVLSVGYKWQAIHRHFGDRYSDSEIDYAVEDQPLGTGGALLFAQKKLRTTASFLLLNGDTWFPVDLKSLLNHHKQNQSDVTVAAKEIANNTRYGRIVFDQTGMIQKFLGAEGGAAFINGGVYVMEPVKFQSSDLLSLERNILPSLLDQKKRLFVYPSSAPFIDIGIPEDYRQFQLMLENNVGIPS